MLTMLHVLPLAISLLGASLPRRAILGSTLSLAIAQAPESAAATSRSSVRDGMTAFTAGRVEESIEMFDQVIADKPAAKPYLWQRGLSLYYADRFVDGADQFKTDVAVNPNDTEEAIWHLLCLARITPGGIEAARKDMLRVGRDRRPVMRAALELFEGTTDEARLLDYSNGSDPGELFYASLYLGLYAEANGDAGSARKFLKRAVDSRYARASGDYMADLARVHVQRRGW